MDIEAENVDLPVRRGEIQIHAVGYYAAHSEIKTTEEGPLRTCLRLVLHDGE